MKTLLFILLLGAATPILAQTDSTSNNDWKHSLVAGLNLTQIALTDWAQGGENALAWTLLLDGKSEKDWEKVNWINTYKFTFGQTRLGSQGLRKTDDNIDVSSVMTYKVGTFLNPYAALTVKSQFAPGYIYHDSGRVQQSAFFDPGYLMQSCGVGYQPLTEVKTRFGVALREIITSTYTKYSDDPGTTDKVEKTRLEGGLEWVTDVSWQLQDNLLFTSRIELFSPLKNFDQTVLRSDNTFTAKISKYITSTLNLQILNDSKISPYTQFKETIALGLSYTIF